jgi:uncharacterized membrane-anchored protein
MQRSITYQNTLSAFLWVGVFCIYSALSSIYLFLPPLFSVIGFLLYRSLIRNDLFYLVIYSIMLLIIEAEKGYWFGSSVLFFILISHYLIPRLEQNMRCNLCVKGIFVLSSYLLFWVFITILNAILLLQAPVLDWHVLFYMGIEFMLIAIFG